MISIIHDLASRQTTLASADLPAIVERSRAERIQLRLTDSLAASALGADASVLFTLKEKGRRNSDPLVTVTLAIADLKENALNVYQKDYDAITAAVNTLLGVSDGSANLITSKQCEGCLSYRETADDDWQDGEPFEVLLQNTPRNEEDDTPVHADTPEKWLNARAIRYLHDVVGITGGGATKLDGLVTVDLNAGDAVALMDDSASSVLRIYELVAGTDAESAPDVIRPDDYDGDENAKVWKLRNPAGAAAFADLAGQPDDNTALAAALAAKLNASALDADPTLAADSDAKVPSQRAVKWYVGNAVTGLLDFKGSVNASGNPNYQAASKGDCYVITNAGKIGGASGKEVGVGDFVIASADNAGGSEFSVGPSWFVLESNLTGITSAGLAMLRGANAAAQTALLSQMVGDAGAGGTKGLVPAPPAGAAAAGKFLKADGTFAVPSGGGGTTLIRGIATLRGYNDTAPSDLPGSQAITFLSADDTVITIVLDGGSSYIFTFAPTDPVNGTIWVDTSTITTADEMGVALAGALSGVFVSYNGGSGAWVEVVSSTAGSASSVSISETGENEIAPAVPGRNMGDPIGEITEATLIPGVSGKMIKCIALGIMTATGGGVTVAMDVALRKGGSTSTVGSWPSLSSGEASLPLSSEDGLNGRDAGESLIARITGDVASSPTGGEVRVWCIVEQSA